MSLFSKIVFLLLSLVVLIIACVYTHVKELREDSSIFQEFIGIDTVKKVDPKTLKDNNTFKPKTSFVKNSFKSDVKTKLLINEDKKIDLVEQEELHNTKLIVPEKKFDVKVLKKQDLKVLYEEEKKRLKSPKEIINKQKTAVDKKVKNVSIPKNKNMLIQEEISAELKKQRIIFKRASFELRNESYLVIKRIAGILNKNNDVRIEVAGHTDAKGAEDVNQYFSLKRAKVVRKVLIKLGVNKSRIIAKGYGESKPLVKNDSQGYSKINRRVEFNIIEETTNE